MNIPSVISAVQKALGFQIMDQDGKAGPDTWTAIAGKLGVKIPDAGEQDDPVDAGRLTDPRSEKNIATLHPRVQPFARALVHSAMDQGITIKVLSGTRTYAEQDALFAKGGVTKARGGYSNHNFGIAFDIGIFDGATYIPESSRYKAIGAIGRSLGLDWGGDWKSFVDQPHFQLRPSWAGGLKESEMLAELRARRASGRDVFA